MAQSPSAADVRGLVRAAIHELLTQLARSGVGVTEVLTEAAQDGTCEVYLSLSPRRENGRASGQPSRPEIIGDVAEAVRAVLREAERPIKAATIASRAGREAHSHFRAVLRRLVRAGEVSHLAGARYWLACRTLPAGHNSGRATGQP